MKSFLARSLYCFKMKADDKLREKEDHMNVAVLVPFRDEPSQNRERHLRIFLETMPPILDLALGPGKWRIFVGVQPLDGHKFSRGRVLNATFCVAMKLYPECDRVILHDVDLIPDVNRAKGYGLCLPSPRLLLALNTTGEYATLAGYIGGICAMHPSQFVLVDGFPNEMEGWGGEDDALRDRIGAGSIGTYTAGTVRNLEEEEEEGVFVRAKNTPSCKMPKEDRRRVRDLWRRNSPEVTGVTSLLFSAKEMFPPKLPPNVQMFEVDVFGWIVATSKSSGKNYYAHIPTGKTQWHRPTYT